MHYEETKYKHGLQGQVCHLRDVCLKKSFLEYREWFGAPDDICAENPSHALCLPEDLDNPKLLLLTNGFNFYFAKCSLS